MKRVVAIVLALSLMMVPMVVLGAFSDVPSDHWAYSYITELTGKGVINGYPDGTYGPDDTLTYGQFLKLIVTASVQGIDYDLVDTDFNHWAAPYLKVAENYGAVAENTVTLENIDAPISRIAVIKIMGICDINMREHEQRSGQELTFSDVDSIDISESIMLRHAVANNIIGGYPDGTFRPNNNLTRAEAAKILSVYMNIQ